NKEYWRLELASVPGPLTLLTGEASEEDIALAGRLTARYSQGRDRDEVEVILEKGDRESRRRVVPMDPDAELIEELRIEKDG
ncbi:MAG: tRNA (5-methylaminomethyl-2-thiouridylate)-methyltransferase, partial [Candidatus Acetothermia bacterium]